MLKIVIGRDSSLLIRLTMTVNQNNCRRTGLAEANESGNTYPSMEAPPRTFSIGVECDRRRCEVVPLSLLHIFSKTLAEGIRRKKNQQIPLSISPEKSQIHLLRPSLLGRWRQRGRILLRRGRFTSKMSRRTRMW